MSVSEQLAAMIFELRSAGSPLAKAKALARAWRTVRRLSPAERKVLAQEAGFDGAEEMLESLATTRGGVAPALMMQLLNSLREKGADGLSDLVVGLKDPKSRDEFLMRGADAVAHALEPQPTDDDEEASIDAVAADQMAAEPKGVPPVPTEDQYGTNTDASPVEMPTSIEDVPDDEGEEGASAEAAEVDHDHDESQDGREQPVSPAPHADDDLLGNAGSVDFDAVIEALEAEPSLVKRLLLLRESIPLIDDAASADGGRVLEIFPQGWPRRRALTALFESGLPVKTGDALDLIDRLIRSSDQRWCLTVLIDRGGFQSTEVERAVAMTGSPTLRGRIRRVSTESL